MPDSVLSLTSWALLFLKPRSLELVPPGYSIDPVTSFFIFLPGANTFYSVYSQNISPPGGPSPPTGHLGLFLIRGNPRAFCHFSFLVGYLSGLR